MSTPKFWYHIGTLKTIRANVPHNIAQVLRKTHDKYGTAFPILDHSEYIDGINIANNEFNSCGVGIQYAFEMYARRHLEPNWDKIRKYRDLFSVTAKMLELKLI